MKTEKRLLVLLLVIISLFAFTVSSFGNTEIEASTSESEPSKPPASDTGAGSGESAPANEIPNVNDDKIVDDIKKSVDENTGGVEYVFHPGPDLGLKIITVEVDVQMKSEGPNNAIKAADDQLTKWQNMMVTGEDGALDFGKSVENVGWSVIGDRLKKDGLGAIEDGIDIVTGRATDKLLNYTGEGGGQGGGTYDGIEMPVSDPYESASKILDPGKKYAVDYLTDNMFYIYENREPFIKSTDDGRLYNIKDRNYIDGIRYEFVKNGNGKRPAIIYSQLSSVANSEPDYYAVAGGFVPVIYLDPANNAVTNITTMQKFADNSVNPVSVTTQSGNNIKLYVRQSPDAYASKQAAAAASDIDKVAGSVSSVMQGSVLPNASQKHDNPLLNIIDDGKTINYKYDIGFDFTRHVYNIMQMDRNHIIILRDGYPWMINNDNYDMQPLFPSLQQEEAYYHFDLENHDYRLVSNNDNNVFILRDGFPWAILNNDGSFDFVFRKITGKNIGGPSLQQSADKKDENGEKDISLFRWTENGPSIRLAQSNSDDSWVILDSGKPSVVISKSEDGKDYETSYVLTTPPEGKSADVKSVDIYNPDTGTWSSGYYYTGGTKAPKNDYGANQLVEPKNFNISDGSEASLSDIMAEAQKMTGVDSPTVKIGDSLYQSYEGDIDLNKLTVHINDQGLPVIMSEDEIYIMEVRYDEVNKDKDVKNKISPHIIYKDKKTGIIYDTAIVTDPKTGKKSEVVFKSEVDKELLLSSQSIYSDDITPLFDLPDLIKMKVVVDFPTRNINEHGKLLVEDALEDIVGEVQTYGQGGGSSNISFGRGGGDEDKSENSESTGSSSESGSNSSSSETSSNIPSTIIPAAPNAGVQNNPSDYENLSIVDAILETSRTFAAQAVFGKGATARDWGGGRAAATASSIGGGQGGGQSDGYTVNSSGQGGGQGGGNDPQYNISDKKDLKLKTINIYEQKCKTEGGVWGIGGTKTCTGEVSGTITTYASPDGAFYVDPKTGVWKTNRKVSTGDVYQPEDISDADYKFLLDYIAPDYLLFGSESVEQKKKLYGDLNSAINSQSKNKKNRELFEGGPWDASDFDSSLDGALPYYMYNDEGAVVDLKQYETLDPDPLFNGFLNYDEMVRNYIFENYKNIPPENHYNFIDAMRKGTCTNNVAPDWVDECQEILTYFSKDGNNPYNLKDKLISDIKTRATEKALEELGYPKDTNYDNLTKMEQYALDQKIKKYIEDETKKIDGVTPKPEDKYEYLYKTPDEREKQISTYKEPSKWPIIDTMQNALTNTMDNLFTIQEKTKEIAGTVWNITRNIAMALVPLSIILSIVVMMRIGASSPSGVAKTRQNIISLLVAIGLAISSYFIIENVFKIGGDIAMRILDNNKEFELGDAVLAFTGDGGGFVSFLFAVLIVFLLLLLIVQVYISGMAMQVQYVSICAFSPLMLVMSAYEPLSWMRDDWFKRVVHCVIIAPANAIVLRIMREAQLMGSNNLATAIIKLALYLGAGSIMITLNASIIKEMFGGLASMAKGAFDAGKGGLNAAKGTAKAGKYVANSRLGQAVGGAIKNTGSNIKSSIAGAAAAGAAAGFGTFGSGVPSIGGGSGSGGGSSPSGASPRLNSSTSGNSFSGWDGSGKKMGDIPFTPIAPAPVKNPLDIKPSSWETTDEHGNKIKDTESMEKEADRVAKLAADSSGERKGSEKYKEIEENSRKEAMGIMEGQHKNFNAQSDPTGSKLTTSQIEWNQRNSQFERASNEYKKMTNPLESRGTRHNASMPEINTGQKPDSNRFEVQSLDHYKSVARRIDKNNYIPADRIEKIATQARDYDIASFQAARNTGMESSYLGGEKGSNNNEKTLNHMQFTVAATMAQELGSNSYGQVMANVDAYMAGVIDANNYMSGRAASPGQQFVVGAMQYSSQQGPASIENKANAAKAYWNKRIS